MSVDPKVVVVVLNWNLPAPTLDCLEALKALEYANAELLVVDNGSDDGSQAIIEAARPDLTLIQTGANLGYAGGNNVGMSEALRRSADFVWILNNDTRAEPEALQAMVEVARAHPEAGVIGSAILTSLPAREERKIAAPAYRIHHERIIDFECPRRSDMCGREGHAVDGVKGTSMMLRRSLIEHLGGFEERYFHYWDDVDLCERAHRAGWAVRYACLGRVWHAVSATISYTSPQARYYYIRNWLLFSRWVRGLGFGSLLRRDPVLTVGMVSAGRWLARGRWHMTAASMLGLADALRGRSGRRELTWGHDG